MTIHFFHAADLHLGSPFKGLQQIPETWREKISQASYQAFDRLIEDAERKKPDFILFAGDIYDGENRSLSAQHHFQLGLKRLAAAQIPVFIIHGNHDHLAGRWTRFDYPENVVVFPENPESHFLRLPHATAQIVGFSYGERHIIESKIQQYPNREPEVQYVIGMLHGSEFSQQEHDVYAPFSIEQLKNKNYDYWALGHIHKRQILHESPSIVYPGTIQGRNRKEVGQQGYMEVKLEATQTELHFIPTSVIRFERMEVDASDARSIDMLIDMMCSHFDSSAEHYIVDCTVIVSRGDWIQVEVDELESFLRGRLIDENSRYYFSHIRFKWQNELSPAYDYLLQKTELSPLPAGFSKYLPQSTELEQAVKLKMETILQERSDGE